MINKKQFIELEKVRIRLCDYLLEVEDSSIVIGIMSLSGRLWRLTHTKRNLTFGANMYLRKLNKLNKTQE